MSKKSMANLKNPNILESPDLKFRSKSKGEIPESCYDFWWLLKNCLQLHIARSPSSERVRTFCLVFWKVQCLNFSTIFFCGFTMLLITQIFSSIVITMRISKFSKNASTRCSQINLWEWDLQLKVPELSFELREYEYVMIDRNSK